MTSIKGIPRAGDLDRRITLQAPVETVDGSGSLSRTWTDLATVYSAVEETLGREFIGAESVQDDSVTTFTIRYRTDVTSKCRIFYNGRYYGVVGDPREIPRRRFLELKGSKNAAQN